MNTRFTILVAAGLLFAGVSQAQNAVAVNRVDFNNPRHAVMVREHREILNDRHEIRKDRHEIREDKRQIKHNRHKIHHHHKVVKHHHKKF